jgi:hypothetical protein
MSYAYDYANTLLELLYFVLKAENAIAVATGARSPCVNVNRGVSLGSKARWQAWAPGNLAADSKVRINVSLRPPIRWGERQSVF